MITTRPDDAQSIKDELLSWLTDLGAGVHNLKVEK